MKRLFNIERWTQAKPGEVLHFPGDAKRTITIELNTETLTRVDLVMGDAEDSTTRFLATVEGMETVEFSVKDPDVWLVFSSDGEVWYYTNDGQDASVRRVGQDTFTVMMGRQPERNRDLELIMFRARQNEIRREAQVAEAIAALQAAKEKFVVPDLAAPKFEGTTDEGPGDEIAK